MSWSDTIVFESVELPQEELWKIAGLSGLQKAATLKNGTPLYVQSVDHKRGVIVYSQKPTDYDPLACLKRGPASQLTPFERHVMRGCAVRRGHWRGPAL